MLVTLGDVRHLDGLEPVEIVEHRLVIVWWLHQVNVRGSSAHPMGDREVQLYWNQEAL